MHAPHQAHFQTPVSRPGRIPAWPENEGRSGEYLNEGRSGSVHASCISVARVRAVAQPNGKPEARALSMVLGRPDPSPNLSSLLVCCVTLRMLLASLSSSILVSKRWETTSSEGCYKDGGPEQSVQSA